MRKIFFIFAGLACAALFLFSFSSASAQTPTVTPSPSAVVSGDCPRSLPVGWGLYTPSPLWSVECGDCPVFITPTVTPSPSASGTPSAFITPTVTPSPSAVSPLLLCSSSLNVTCSSVDDVTISFVAPSGDNYSNGANFGYSSNVGGILYARLEVLSGSGVAYSHQYSTDYRPLVFQVGNVEGYTLPTLHSVGYSTYEEADLGVYDFSFDMGDEIFQDDFVYMTSILGDSVNRFYFRFGSVLTLSLSPTFEYIPPPVDVGYCSTVLPPISSDFGFDLFIPDGVSNCSMGWDAFEVGSYIIPAVTICFQPSNFGVVTLFGTAYDVGVYALASAGAFFYRYLRTV